MILVWNVALGKENLKTTLQEESSEGSSAISGGFSIQN